MKTISIDNSILSMESVANAIEEQNITLTCNADMNIEISEEDYEKLCNIIDPADIYEVEEDEVTNEMYDALNHYAANLWTSAKVAEIFGVSEEKVQDVFAETDFQNEYENAPSDEYGFTKKGDEFIDNLLETVAHKILA